MKKGFTIIELIISIAVSCSVVAVILSVSYIITHTLYTGQISMQSRSDISYYMFYLTREIQSAEKIKISDKRLQIMQAGDSDYTLDYKIVENSEFDELVLNNKKIAVINYDESIFSEDDGIIKINLAVLDNNVDYNGIERMVTFSVSPRTENVIIRR